MRSEERNFESLDYTKSGEGYSMFSTKQAKLTQKQYLVYSYLVSLSMWNGKDQERHYYVYKNQFKVKDAAAFIGISQPTWRKALEVLEHYGYIKVEPKWILIYWQDYYTAIHLDIIKYLLQAGRAITGGGNIVAVYSVIARYWEYTKGKGVKCEITENQLRKLFTTKTKHKEDSNVDSYTIMLGLFEISGLMKIQTHRRDYAGKPYTAYEIQDVKLKSLPAHLKDETGGPSDITDILKVVEDSIELSTEW